MSIFAWLLAVFDLVFYPYPEGWRHRTPKAQSLPEWQRKQTACVR